MRDTEWLETVGKREKAPKFDEIVRDPEKLMRFTGMCERILETSALPDDERDATRERGSTSPADAVRGPGETTRPEDAPVAERDLVIRVSNTVTRTVKGEHVKHLRSALRKLHVNTNAPGASAGRGDFTPSQEKLTVDEIRAIAPVFEKYTRATQTVEAFQGEERFTDEEIKGLVNWAAKNSPELSGLLVQLGNSPDFFAKALKTLAYAPDPRAFLALRAKLEAARNIAVRDLPLHRKLTELGEKYGVPVQDMLDAIDKTTNVRDASHALQALIVPAFGSSKLAGLFSKDWLNKTKAKAAVLSLEHHLNPFLARRSAREAALGSGRSKGIAEDLLQLVVGSLDSDKNRTGEGLLSRDFANEIVGAKGSPDYASSQDAVRNAVGKVRTATMEESMREGLSTPENYRARGISEELMARARAGDEDAITDVAQQFLHHESEKAYAGVDTERSRGLWHSLWVGIKGAFKSVFYSQKDVDKVKGFVRGLGTAPTAA